jgi:hypothetical protein
LRSIGLETPKRLLLLVEDRGAREVLRALLAKYARGLLQEAEILSVGGKDNITSCLNLIPAATVQLRLVGLYDGDARNEIGVLKNGWPTTALPFSSAIETEFRALVDGGSPTLSQRLGIPLDSIAVVHASLVGKDKHDWLMDLGADLGCSYERLVAGLVDVWLEIGETRGQVETFCKNLETMCA